MKKSLNKSSAWAVPNLLKTLKVLSDTTVRKSSINQEDLKLYWELEKEPPISLGNLQAYY